MGLARGMSQAICQGEGAEEATSSEETVQRIVEVIQLSPWRALFHIRKVTLLKRESIAGLNIDIYSDNVGGECLEVAVEGSTLGECLIMCGHVSQYGIPPESLQRVRNTDLIFQRRLILNGYLVPDTMLRLLSKFLEEIPPLLAGGKLKLSLGNGTSGIGEDVDWRRGGRQTCRYGVEFEGCVCQFLPPLTTGLSIQVNDTLVVHSPLVCHWKADDSDPDSFVISWGALNTNAVSQSVHRKDKGSGDQPLPPVSLLGLHTMSAVSGSNSKQVLDRLQFNVVTSTVQFVIANSLGEPRLSSARALSQTFATPSSTQVPTPTPSDSVPFEISSSDPSTTIITLGSPSSDAETNLTITTSQTRTPARSESQTDKPSIPVTSSTSSATSISVSSNTSSTTSSNPSNVGAIVGIVFGVLIGVLLIIVGVLLLLRSRRRRKSVSVFDQDRMIRGLQPSSYHQRSYVDALEPSFYATGLEIPQDGLYPPEKEPELPEYGYTGRISPGPEKRARDR
ncbi:hypothetical protein C8J56DRAFT_1164528 [Mycena floridula]|nr:hypothetical protein C8J56DRAFT_1164528 [Mycena floridula]